MRKKLLIDAANTNENGQNKKYNDNFTSKIKTKIIIPENPWRHINQGNDDDHQAFIK